MLGQLLIRRTAISNFAQSLAMLIINSLSINNKVIKLIHYNDLFCAGYKHKFDTCCEAKSVSQPVDAVGNRNFANAIEQVIDGIGNLQTANYLQAEQVSNHKNYKFDKQKCYSL